MRERSILGPTCERRVSRVRHCLVSSSQSQPKQPSLTSESHAEPWVAAGVSRATYFRKKREADRALKRGEASA